MSTIKDAGNDRRKAGIGRYMPGIDGLRALSVLAVIAYHLNVPWAPGGLLGVGVFFVLSGYLITDQLLAQWQRTRRIDLKEFWMRRVRRLMPAMLFMLAAVGVYLAVFDYGRLEALRGDFLSSTFYYNNWYLILHKVSYFESFGPPSPIGHLWSLAIEEQFYILWPLSLAAGLVLLRTRGRLLVGTLAVAALSAVAMAAVYEPGVDPSRVYYGTDTRAFALLIGAALAVVWPSRKLSASLSGRSRLALELVGGVGLAAIAYMVWRTDEYDDSLYLGGLAAFSVLAAAVTAVVAHPASLVGKVMGARPLRWIGKRSYSLYIWHYPVIVLTSPSVDTDGLNVGRAVIQAAASVLLAAFSYKFVEEPFRRGTFASLRGAFRLGLPFRPGRAAILAALAGTVFIVSCADQLKADHPFSPASAQDKPAVEALLPPASSAVAGDDDSEPPAPLLPGRDDKPAAPEVKPEKPASASESTSKPDEPSHSVKPTKPVKPKKPAEDVTDAPKDSKDSKDTKDTKPGAGDGIVAIGDSVLLDAAPYLEKQWPGILIDGKVGRQMTQAQEVVDLLAREGKLKGTVVIELGTNGSFSAKQLNRLLDSLDDAKKIVLVNTRVPRKWQDNVNAALEKAAARYPKATLVDWYSASAGHDEYFAHDGVHLMRAGAKSYSTLLGGELKKH